MSGIDVHQHLWPKEFIDVLRRRTAPPRLDGWVLKLNGEPDLAINPSDHDVSRRADLVDEDELDQALISLSSPLGIEYLPYDESRQLLDAFHEGALDLGPTFGVWASVNVVNAEPDDLATLLRAGCVGLQLPATAMHEPHAVQALMPLLKVLQRENKPLFVHPGSATTTHNLSVPSWWPAMVPYVNQMHSAWFSYKSEVETAMPELRACFAMLAGLAPMHDERGKNRGGPTIGESTHLFVDTSSYGTQAIGAIAEVMGVHAIVHGSDRPYAPPPVIDEALLHTNSRLTNPVRLLGRN